MLTINDIYKVLPHRYPFLMVDRIIDVQKNESVVGIKNVTVNEPYFQGHFPDEPIMPGAMIIETISQVGGFIFDIESKRGYISRVDKVKFVKKVIPGDTLVVECTKIAMLGDTAKIKGVVKVDNEMVASAEISYSFAEVNN